MPRSKPDFEVGVLAIGPLAEEGAGAMLNQAQVGGVVARRRVACPVIEAIRS